MKRQVMKYVVSTLLVSILVLSAFFLPQNYSQFKDENYLSKISLVDRERSVTSTQYDISMEEKMAILAVPEKQGTILAPVLRSEGNMINRDKLLENVYKELRTFTDYLTFPLIEEQLLTYHYVYADLYSVNSMGTDDGTLDNVLFWVLRFTDYENFDMIVCADAYDYTIYEVQTSTNEYFNYEGQELYLGNLEELHNYYKTSSVYSDAMYSVNGDCYMSYNGIDYFNVISRYIPVGSSNWLPGAPTVSHGISAMYHWLNLNYQIAN